MYLLGRITIKSKLMEQFEKAFYRERTAREIAEESLEKKSRELYYAHEELVLKQNQLIISEKMASLGLISAGIAHEINNPLSFLLSNLNTLNEYFQEMVQLLDQVTNMCVQSHDPHMEPLSPQSMYQNIRGCLAAKNYNFLVDDIQILLDESKVGVCRIRDIVKGLKGISHSQIHDPQEVDINEQLKVVLDVMNPQIKNQCTIYKKFAPLPFIKCYPDQLSQVFMNLFVNAYQSIENQGEIHVETRSINNGIEIKVSDTGCGIHPDNMKKLFTPFFTTKPVGVGTGLGLSISYDIIKSHGGTIHIDSVVERGTTVVIWLPQSSPISSSLALVQEQAS